MLFWSGVVRPGTKAFARSRFALGARTIVLRAHCRATRSKARLVSKSIHLCGQDQIAKERIADAREIVHQRDGTAGEPAAVSLLTLNTAFEHIEDMQYASDANKLNTRHRRAPRKRIQVVHRLDKVIVLNGLAAD